MKISKKISFKKKKYLNIEKIFIKKKEKIIKKLLFLKIQLLIYLTKIKVVKNFKTLQLLRLLRKTTNFFQKQIHKYINDIEKYSIIIVKIKIPKKIVLSGFTTSLSQLYAIIAINHNL